jgi:hypothetical protein
MRGKKKERKKERKEEEKERRKWKGEREKDKLRRVTVVGWRGGSGTLSKSPQLETEVSGPGHSGGLSGTCIGGASPP